MAGIPIRGRAKGSAAKAFATAKRRGAKRLDFTEAFFNHLYEDAETAGTNADVAVAQWDLETGSGTSRQWEEFGNPGGIAVFPDGTTAGYTFTAAAAARELITHMLVYAGVDLPAGWMKSHRWDVVVGKGWAGTVTTTDDLGNGKWATDKRYAEKLEERYIAYWGEPDAPAEEPTTMVRFEKRIAIKRLKNHTAKLRDLLAWFTIHENGNERSSPYDEAAFVNNGGGSGAVLYHFTVGVEDGEAIIVQIFPADRRGKHAGNATGNAVSVAVEVCQAPPGALSAMVQEALRELLYMLYTHDERIDWGDGDYAFSPDRTCGHKDWAGANPGCPEYMTRAWGGVVPVVKAVRDRLAAGEGPAGPVYVKPAPLAALQFEGVPPTLMPFDGSDFVYVNRMVVATKDTPRLQLAYAGAPKVGPDIKAGERFMVDWLFRADDGNWYYVTPWWTRVIYADTEPVAEELQEAA